MGNSSSSLNASLIKACQQGEIEKVKHLLGLGAKVNSSDDNRSTPLMWACACGRASVVQFLIELKDARITDVDSDGYTCLHWAVIEKHPSVVKYLLTRCKSSSLIFNENKNKNEIENDDELKNDVSNNKNVANKKRNSSSLLLLNVDCKNVQGDTPLHKAIYYSQKKIAQMLINAGANINEYNKREETPLDKARRNDIKLWLKSIGAKANVKQNYEIEGDHKLDLTAEEEQQMRRQSMKEEVIDWLKNDLSFAEYVDNFIDNGYDRFDAVFEMSKKDLVGIGIKYGHIKIILNSIERLKFENYTNEPGCSHMQEEFINPVWGHM